MDRFAPSPHEIAEALRMAPGWARVGLTFGDEQLRDRATLELAQAIIGALETPKPVHDARQILLPL